MAAIGFDTLKTARRLKDAGVPEAQEEVQAEVMAEAFVFNMDALVTKDYLDQCLDARFARHESSFEARLMAKIEPRLRDHAIQLEQIRGEMWANMPEGYKWLKNWEWV